MVAKSKKFISFQVADGWYALPALSGTEFIAVEQLSPLPITQDKVAGLIYHNGNIVTVLDTAMLISIKGVRSDVNINNCLLFVYQGHFYALLIKEAGEILKATQLFTDRKKRRFNKYFKVKNNKFYILEPEEILSSIEIYGE